MVNQTVLPTPATTKSRPSPAVSETTPLTAVKSTPASGTNKDKHTAVVNQTVSIKHPSTSDVKSTKDKSVPSGAPNVQSASTRTVSASSAKTTKDKLQSAVTQTVAAKSPSSSDGKTAKDKSTTTVVQNVQSISPKKAPASGAKNTKNKPAASVNQTVVVKSNSTSHGKKDKPTPTAVKTAPSTQGKEATVGGSAVDKDKGTSSANQTAVIKAPTTHKEKPTPVQPIKVVISEGCESGHTKEQQLELKPGAPLVMTHKISLLPGGCSGGCESEMTALKERVTRLEREMSSLKEKCMNLSYSPGCSI